MTPKPTKVLTNANELLTLLADRGTLGPADIAGILGMPRPSVYRLLEALEVIGLVSTGADGRSTLGLQNLHLAEASLATIPEQAAARKFLVSLSAELGQTAYFCVRRGSRIFCLDWVQGERVSLLALTPGNSLPVHAGATSRVITANEPRVLARLKGSDDLERFTPFTLSNYAQMTEDAAMIARRGYSISDQDVTLGIAAVGAAIVDGKGHVRGAISIAGLRDDVIPNAAVSGAMLVEAAARIAAALPQ